jgi:peptide/nickel transport system ATP-binding protein
MSDPLLRIDQLRVRFETTDGSVDAVRGVSLELRGRERLGLVGESGCGKSTIVLALLGLLPANATVSGRVLVDGDDILARGEASIRPYRWTSIAVVPQAAMNALNPVKTIGRQLAETMELHGIGDRAERRRRSGELLDRVGIPSGRLNSYPHQLSGGMRQRVAVALALSCGPRILLADEPTTALDVIAQAQVIDLIGTLAQDMKLAFMLITHDLALVSNTCERLAVMYAGEIVEVGEMQQVLEQPAHPYSERLFAATPSLDDGRELSSIPGTPPRLDQKLEGCSFAPRCARSFEPCSRLHPELIQINRGHVAACHLNDRALVGSLEQHD